MKKIALLASGLTALGILPSPSQAAPLSVDSITMGSLNGTWDEWPAMWPTQNAGIWEQYLMTRAPDGTTFVNAGMSSANIIFRAFNGGQRALPGGGMARAWLDEFGILNNGGLNALRHAVGTQDYGILSVLTGTSQSPAIRAQAHWRGLTAVATGNGGTAIEATGGPSGGRGLSASGQGVGGWGVLAQGFSSAGGLRATSGGGAMAIYASNNNGASPGVSSAAVYADGSIQGNNFMHLTAWIEATGFFTTSDQRLKKDITDFNGGLDGIEKIHVVKYKYNGVAETQDGQEQVGVLAQELEQTHPQLVSTFAGKLNPNDERTTDIKRVNQTALTYMLINAVKDLKGQVNDLQKIVCHDHPDQPGCAKKGGSRP